MTTTLSQYRSRLDAALARDGDDSQPTDNLTALLSERAYQVEQMRALVEGCESRQKITKDEERQVDALADTIKTLDARIARAEARGMNGLNLHVGRPAGDGVILGREERLRDYVAERRGGFPGFAGLDALDPSEFNLARCIKSMVTGERSHLSDTERRAMSEGSAADGGFLLPSPLAATVIDLARNKTRVIEAGAGVVPMENATLAIPRLASGVSGSWKRENDPIDQEAQTYERVTFTAKTCITLIRLSAELWDDATAPAHSIFQGDLVAALAAKLDYAALRGSGTDPEPRGIRNQTGVTILDLGPNGKAVSDYSFLVNAIGAVRDANGEPNAAIYASRTQTALDLKVDSTGQPLRMPESVAALTKLVSNAVPTNLTHGSANSASECFVADWSTVLIGVRPSLAVRVIPLRERFMDAYQYGLIAVLRADVQLRQPQHAAVVTGIL